MQGTLDHRLPFWKGMNDIYKKMKEIIEESLKFDLKNIYLDNNIDIVLLLCYLL